VEKDLYFEDLYWQLVEVEVELNLHFHEQEKRAAGKDNLFGSGLEHYIHID